MTPTLLGSHVSANDSLALAGTQAHWRMLNQPPTLCQGPLAVPVHVRRTPGFRVPPGPNIRVHWQLWPPEVVHLPPLPLPLPVTVALGFTSTMPSYYPIMQRTMLRATGPRPLPWPVSTSTSTTLVKLKLTLRTCFRITHHWHWQAVGVGPFDDPPDPPAHPRAPRPPARGHWHRQFPIACPVPVAVPLPAVASEGRAQVVNLPLVAVVIS